MVIVVMSGKVERSKLASCMTCPLCHRLFIDATTISECLHTFCRKCIYEKIIYEYLKSCPVCKIYLGCAPIEKLRADNSLQDLLCKIFPSKRRKSQVPDDFPLISTRKERSISSLVVSKAAVSTNSNQLLNTKPNAHLKNATIDLESDFTSDALDDDSLEDHLHDERLNDRPNNVTCSGQQRSIISPQKNPPAAECSRQRILNRTPENSTEAPEEKSHFVKRFGHLIRYVSKTKPKKIKPRRRKKTSCLLAASSDAAKVLRSENGESVTPSTSSAALKPGRQKRPVESEGPSTAAQAIIAANRSQDLIQGPVWLALIASEDQGDERLPQIASSYLRIKDGNLPVAYIKRYLVQKLGLSCENQVKISVRGQPVRATVPLQNLVRWWLHIASESEAIHTSVGSSAHEFVMVLSYSRNVQHPKI